MLQSRPFVSIALRLGLLLAAVALGPPEARAQTGATAPAPRMEVGPGPDSGAAPGAAGPGTGPGAPAGEIAAAPGAAQSEVFTVGGIEVDASAGDAVTARGQALRQGQQAGLDRLLRRLVPQEDYGRLPPASSLPIDDYVQSFEIANEELSSTRYIAELTVAYEPDAVRTLLRQGGFAFAQTVSMPLVVLPLYQSPEGARLWPDDNPWWQAWSEHMDPEQLLRLVLPLGDLEDITTVSVAQAQAGDAAALTRLARRYGAQDALVVTATAEGGGEGGGPDQVSAVRFEAQRVGPIVRQGQPLTLPVRPDRPLEAVLADAVVQLQASLDERWKSANLLRYDQGGTMLVGVPIARLADWVAVKRGLERMPEISEIAITSFARDQVGLELRYIGDQFRLDQALARLGFALTREGESWLLLPTGGNPSQGGQPSATSSSF